MSYWAITDHTGRTSFFERDDEWVDVYLDSLSYEW
jgi:hypothetical protein